jgi:uncharacterized protein (UPF0548 family)
LSLRPIIGDPRTLAALRSRPLNFDPAELRDPSRWVVDERTQPLPTERPGPPEPGGAWEVARGLMHGYEFADPWMVRACYDPDTPLAGRDLLLEVRFRALRIRVGCRVSEVYDHSETLDGRMARVWGWSYRTLKGHFEQGEMHWSAVKWPHSGAVAFRITARSRPSPDPGPLVRLGFRLFGRREQLRFYDHTCERMRRLVEAAMAL